MSFPVSARARRQGNHALAFLLVFMVLIGFASLVIDLNFQRTVKLQLQHGVESAAHAGAAYLERTSEGLRFSRETAQDMGLMAVVNGDPLVLDQTSNSSATGTTATGIWDGATFTPSVDHEQVNALRVEAHVDVSTLLAGVAFGRDALGANSRAIALLPDPQGAGGVDCFLPLAVPDCLLYEYSVEDLPDLEIHLNPAGVDTGGYANPTGVVNAAFVRDQLRNCENSGYVQVGDNVNLQNGEVVDGYRAIANAVESSSTFYNTSVFGPLPARHSGSAINVQLYGRTLEGPVILFDGGPEYCEGRGGSFNGSERITGFIWASIYDVKTSGAHNVDRNIWMRLDSVTPRRISDQGGGLDAGILYQPPPLLVY